MRRLIRWISLAVLAVLQLPILNEFALQDHLYDNPPESVSTLLEYVMFTEERGDLLVFHVTEFDEVVA